MNDECLFPFSHHIRSTNRAFLDIIISPTPNLDQILYESDSSHNVTRSSPHHCHCGVFVKNVMTFWFCQLAISRSLAKGGIERCHERSGTCHRRRISVSELCFDRFVTDTGTYLLGCSCLCVCVCVWEIKDIYCVNNHSVWLGGEEAGGLNDNTAQSQ